MENASKALLMAAAMLVGILILSIAVYLFVSFGATSAEIHKQNEENRLNQFNTQFTAYEGKKDVTIYDVITIANLATENNIYYEFEQRNNTDGKDNYISVYLQDTGYIEKAYSNNTRNTNYDNLLSADLENIDTNDGTLQKYECQVYISEITQRVYKVTINKR